MGEKGGFEDEKDGRVEGYLRERGGIRKRWMGGIEDGRERIMGRRGGREKREDFRMRKIEGRRLFEEEGRQKDEDRRNRRWEEEKYRKKRRMGKKGGFEDEEDWGKRVI